MATLLISPAKPYKLEQPLGKWIQNPDRIYSTVVDPDTKILYKESEIQGVYSKLRPSRTHRCQYNQNTEEQSMLPEVAIPVKCNINPDFIMISKPLFIRAPIQPSINTFQ